MRLGVERRLKQAVPEVEAVEAVEAVSARE
jgi:hypothetical protein